MSEDHFNDLPRSIAVVGVGLMGGSLGLALRQLPSRPRVIGIGRDAGRLRRAVDLGAVDEASTDLAAAEDVEAVVLCSTIRHILETLPVVLARVPRATTVTDVGSTKSQIVAAAGAHENFVGGHPMAGSERAGVDSARADLYRGATWAVTPGPSTDDRHARRVRAIAEAAGARVLILEPEVHDAIVAITSHVPHALASALVQEADAVRSEHGEAARMTAGSFADMTRIAASPAEIWRDVCVTNRDAVLASLAGLGRRIETLAQAVRTGDADAVEAFFAAGQAAKAGWPAARKTAE